MWEAAPTLLSRKGYAADVRRDCLALSLWLLSESHVAGDEKSLTPSKKTPRLKQRPPATTPSVGATVAPNLMAAMNAENLVVKDGTSAVTTSAGGGGGGGSGGGGGQGGGGGRAVPSGGLDAAASPARGQYWSAHLTLVSVFFVFSVVVFLFVCSFCGRVCFPCDFLWFQFFFFFVAPKYCCRCIFSCRARPRPPLPPPSHQVIRRCRQHGRKCAQGAEVPFTSGSS